MYDSKGKLPLRRLLEVDQSEESGLLEREGGGEFKQLVQTEGELRRCSKI